MKEGCFSHFPVFDLGNMLLRDLKPTDVVYYFEYITHPKVAEFISANNLPVSLKEAAEDLKYWSSLYQLKRSFYWGIACKETNKLIGTIGYNIIIPVHRRAEVSYDLSYCYWGKNIMGLAMEKILEFAREIGIIRVQATTLPDNQRSIKLLERSGFEYEGLLKNYEYLHGEYRDSIMYAKILT